MPKHAIIEEGFIVNFEIHDQAPANSIPMEPGMFIGQEVVNGVPVAPAVQLPPITDYRASVYDNVRGKLYRFITAEDQCDFPEWKQANYSSRLAELADKVANGQALDQAEADERTAILSVVVWKNSLLAERDRVKAAIDAAADHAGVDDAAASLALTAPPFAL